MIYIIEVLGCVERSDPTCPRLPMCFSQRCLCVCLRVFACAGTRKCMCLSSLSLSHSVRIALSHSLWAHMKTRQCVRRALCKRTRMGRRGVLCMCALTNVCGEKRPTEKKTGVKTSIYFGDHPLTLEQDRED